MRMLTKKSRDALSAFAAQNGLSAVDALNVILEVIVPLMQPDRVSAVLDQSDLRWLRLDVGEAVVVDVGAGGEAAFRARIARHRRNAGRVISVRKVGPTEVEVRRHVGDE